jgi:hypothetical protein
MLATANPCLRAYLPINKKRRTSNGGSIRQGSLGVRDDGRFAPKAATSRHSSIIRSLTTMQHKGQISGPRSVVTNR